MQGVEVAGLVSAAVVAVSEVVGRTKTVGIVVVAKVVKYQK